MALAISMKFKGNSKLLEDFIDAVERKIVKWYEYLYELIIS